MRGRQKFCDLRVYVSLAAADDLLGAARRRRLPWHEAHDEIERRLAERVGELAEEIIAGYAAEAPQG